MTKKNRNIKAIEEMTAGTTFTACVGGYKAGGR
jgi:hypothetical protein